MTIDKIQDRENALSEEKERFLRRMGWKHTCETPGSYWVWTRTWRGCHLMAPTDLAVRMQASIYPEE